MKYTLIKYRDAGLHSYTWFWINEHNQVISPYFNTEEEAKNWANNFGLVQSG